ncbi:hypothetical protein MPH_04357 [Macrophomina phaseolina MS6]|uniref:Uncharacterized protein n=1 Tax=Macrophomina phaseolina (strain MS6) TaxID=1126212 RepID=K2R7K9_MACPH|nr:hypothetical protein MPH_04357 [Macrophomina phaseolina MS6]
MTLSAEAIISIVSVVVQVTTLVVGHYFGRDRVNGLNRWRIVMRAEARGWVMDFEENNALQPGPAPGMLVEIRDAILRQIQAIRDLVARVFV